AEGGGPLAPPRAGEPAGNHPTAGRPEDLLPADVRLDPRHGRSVSAGGWSQGGFRACHPNGGVFEGVGGDLVGAGDAAIRVAQRRPYARRTGITTWSERRARGEPAGRDRTGRATRP